jgi:hypothetical protein
MIRATYYATDNGAAIVTSAWRRCPTCPTDSYRTNIQISEINALNACLAVIRSKQLRGF